MKYKLSYEASIDSGIVHRDAAEKLVPDEMDYEPEDVVDNESALMFRDDISNKTHQPPRCPVTIKNIDYILDEPNNKETFTNSTCTVGWTVEQKMDMEQSTLMFEDPRRRILQKLWAKSAGPQTWFSYLGHRVGSLVFAASPAKCTGHSPDFKLMDSEQLESNIATDDGRMTILHRDASERSRQRKTPGDEYIREMTSNPALKIEVQDLSIKKTKLGRINAEWTSSEVRQHIESSGGRPIEKPINLLSLQWSLWLYTSSEACHIT